MFDVFLGKVIDRNVEAYLITVNGLNEGFAEQPPARKAWVFAVAGG